MIVNYKLLAHLKRALTKKLMQSCNRISRGAKKSSTACRVNLSESTTVSPLLYQEKLLTHFYFHQINKC